MQESPKPAQKMYVLDTNVLLHDPRSLFSFQGALVGIPIMVLEELETFKRETSGRGKNARETVRYLDQLREKGSLSKGVPIEGGGQLRILFAPDQFPEHSPLDTGVVDNEIILTAASYQKEGYDVRFISKDLNARVKADVVGIEAEDYLKGYVPKEEFYKGWVRVQVPAVQLKQDVPDELRSMAKATDAFIMNEYVLVESNNNPHNYRVFRYIGGKLQFKPVTIPRFSWPLEARNPQQLMALDALLDPALDLVSLIGPAGTGKTFLALLAGLHEVLVTETYTKLLVSRPIVPLGADIGYLPGDVQEKLHYWMQPIFDNLEVILHAAKGQQQESRHQQEEQHFEERNYDERHDHQGHYKKFKKQHRGKERRPGGLGSVHDLVRQDKLSLEAITYMRGRSIPYQYILFDEVQNLSPHEVKTLLSRVGQGSKIVMCGDATQIDSPYLDFSSNGLVIASDKFKGQNLFATVYLENSERSTLSSLVSELL